MEEGDELKNALARLPQYEPDEAVWNHLQQQLDEEKWRSELVKLPQYQPDDRLWDCIETGLEQHRRKDRRWLYVAASVLLMAVFSYHFFGRDGALAVEYAEMQLDDRLQPSPDQTTNEFKLLTSVCESDAVVCMDERFKSLKKEYETLEDASTQLRTVMGSFNTEPQLVHQLDQLEREKASVLNEMAKLI